MSRYQPHFGGKMTVQVQSRHVHSFCGEIFKNLGGGGENLSKTMFFTQFSTTKSPLLKKLEREMYQNVCLCFLYALASRIFLKSSFLTILCHFCLIFGPFFLRFDSRQVHHLGRCSSLFCILFSFGPEAA